MSALDPFSDDYDPDLVWLKTYDDAPPHHSKEYRVRVPSTVDHALKRFVVSRQGLWLDPQSLIRPAIYHGLHHLGEVIQTGEDLMEIAGDYAGAYRAGRLLEQFRHREQMLEGYREATSKGRTKDERAVTKAELQYEIRRQQDPEIRDELVRMLEGMG